MPRFPHVRRLRLAAAASVVLASASAAQGGWRQWDVQLRDGTRVEASPLGAPDDTTLSVSAGVLQRRGRTIPRARVEYLAAPDAGGDVPAPRCTDVVVHRDGRRTVGHVTLTRVAFSEGIVTQRGVDIDLRHIAFIRFARASRAGCAHHAPLDRRRTSPHA